MKRAKISFYLVNEVKAHAPFVPTANGYCFFRGKNSSKVRRCDRLLSLLLTKIPKFTLNLKVQPFTASRVEVFGCIFVRNTVNAINFC